VVALARVEVNAVIVDERPLIAVNKPDMFPLPVALALLRGAYAAESYGPIMAGAVLSALPLLIVFLFANRRIVEGVRVSALKG